jgi:hypothetical protein
MPLPSEHPGALAGKTDDPETCFVVHDEQGRILRAGTAPLSAVPWQALEGGRVAVTLHPADPQAWRVVDGALVPIPDPPSPAHVFDYGAGAWRLDGLRAAALLAGARGRALSEAVALIDARAEAITGTVPLVERLSWGAKDAAARAVIAGLPNPEELAMIAGEARITGEAVMDLAARIRANADAWRLIAARMAALRRQVATAIAEAGDEGAIALILAGLALELDQIARSDAPGQPPEEAPDAA